MQSYLKSNIFYLEESKMLFKLRSRMLNVKSNFSSMYKDNMNCRLCKKVEENQEHILKCEFLTNDNENHEDVKYTNIFSTNNDEMKEVVRILIEKWKERNSILENIF